jgi:nucleotide-binding universal stress UspA family protein
MYERIVVPTDGSACASAAVEHATDIAQQYDASLHLLSVVDSRNISHGSPAVSPAQIESTLQEQAEGVVSEAADEAASEGLSVQTEVITGIPDTAIIDYAEENDLDLIVMGTHGRTGLHRYLLGSVTERTVRQSPVPVLTIRNGEE